MREKSEVFQIRVPVSTMENLRKLAKRRKLTMSEIGRLALADYLVRSPGRVKILLTPDTVEEVARIFRQEMKKLEDEKSTADI